MTRMKFAYTLFILALLISNCLAAYKGETCATDDDCESKTGSSSCGCFCVATFHGKTALTKSSQHACNPLPKKCSSEKYTSTSSKKEIPEGGACKINAKDTAHINGARSEYDDMFDARQEYEELLADYEYDEAVEQAREERMVQRLRAEKNKVLKAKNRLQRFRAQQNDEW